jgi:hypothetical protein
MIVLFMVVGVMERDMSVVEVPATQVLSFESNEMTYELKGFTSTGEYPLLQGCVTVPDQRGWVPVVQLVNETTGETSEMGKYTKVTDPESADANRVCHEILFYDATVNKGDVVTLEVQYLAHYLDLVDASDLAKIKATVNAVYPELDFVMVVENNTGDGGIGFRITKNPNEVTDAELNEAINAAAIEKYVLNIEITLEQ